jgi:D-alanine-D-alanine ligase
MKIAVFMGGSSAEREVSLNSGRSVADALRKNSHEVTVSDVEWFGSSSLFHAVGEARSDGTDVVFLALHGGLGENGGVQGILEAAGIAYTGSGIAASAVAMDKHISKTLFRHHGIPTADWYVAEPDEITPGCIEREIGWPCIIKPVDQGSTIGLSLVRGPDELPGALEMAASAGTRILAESYLPGKELSVPVLGDRALPVIEIRPSHELYDYECKYTSGMSQYFTPAPIPKRLADEIAETALAAFRALGLRDIARIDFRLDRENRPVCLEANTLPGMTATSLVPKSAAVAGIDFPDLVTRISEMAYQRKGVR